MGVEPLIGLPRLVVVAAGGEGPLAHLDRRDGGGRGAWDGGLDGDAPRPSRRVAAACAHLTRPVDEEAAKAERLESLDEEVDGISFRDPSEVEGGAVILLPKEPLFEMDPAPAYSWAEGFKLLFGGGLACDEPLAPESLKGGDGRVKEPAAPFDPAANPLEKGVERGGEGGRMVGREGVELAHFGVGVPVVVDSMDLVEEGANGRLDLGPFGGGEGLSDQDGVVHPHGDPFELGGRGGVASDEEEGEEEGERSHHHRLSAIWRQLRRSMAMVSGPIPPGTGVMAEQILETGSKSTSPTSR